MLKSNYTEIDTGEITFPCIGRRNSGYNGFEQVILFHNVTSGIVLFSTKKEEIGRYSSSLNFLDFQEFKGSVTITNV